MGMLRRQRGCLGLSGRGGRRPGLHTRPVPCFPGNLGVGQHLNDPQLQGLVHKSRSLTFIKEQALQGKC